MFIEPFTWGLWVVTGAILMYTMFTVWFLEHQSNPEFSGPWKNQISTALWFTFSSLFFAHREKINRNDTRLVILVWLFVVMILTSSYTASLSSMLTVQQLKEFKSKNIAAAFLELPYAKVFLNKYCNEFTGTMASNKYGGFGFAFQKGSPIARDFSKAILQLSENGDLKSLEDEWLTPSHECSTNKTSNRANSLSVKSFGFLYLLSFFTSTICLLLSLIRWGDPMNQGSPPTPADISSTNEGISDANESPSRLDLISNSNSPENHPPSPNIFCIKISSEILVIDCCLADPGNDPESLCLVYHAPSVDIGAGDSFERACIAFARRGSLISSATHTRKSPEISALIPPEKIKECER